MATKQVPTEAEVLGYMKSLSNWGRWGPDDEMGTLNLITPQKRAQAAGLVREGIAVSCSRLIEPKNAPDVGETRFPPIHYMVSTGEAAPEKGRWMSSDVIALYYHGMTITHIDSICHMFWDGKMYNGKPASLVGVQTKAAAGGIQLAKDGVATRGVLLDIAKLKGKDWLEAGEPVFPEDLEAAERAQGVRVEEGDALCLRLGWYRYRQEVGPREGGDRPGLHAATLPWLHERGVSIIVADASQDVSPSGYEEMTGPIHSIGIVAMGLWLIDAANFDELAPVCERLNRWDFQFVVAPLNFLHATGSPVNPLAIL
jgi:kynurenine formamidase